MYKLVIISLIPCYCHCSPSVLDSFSFKWPRENPSYKSKFKLQVQVKCSILMDVSLGIHVRHNPSFLSDDYIKFTML